MKPPPVTKTMTGAGAVKFAGTENEFFSIQYFLSLFSAEPLHSYFIFINTVKIRIINSLLGNYH
jgi:hypothetical protein